MALCVAGYAAEQQWQGEERRGEASRDPERSGETPLAGGRSGMARLAGARGGEHFLAVATSENLEVVEVGGGKVKLGVGGG